MILLYIVVLVLFSIYSFALMDPNITLVNHSAWDAFRSIMLPLGYYHREWSFFIYALMLILLFFFQWYFVKKGSNPVMVAGGVVLATFISYPFLSHDLFNYMFDAKIVTVYGSNPYLHVPLEYVSDPWLRFMHWTHRPYPYGPLFLLVSILPAFMAMGKLLPMLLLFRLTWGFIYVCAVIVLARFDKRSALFVATSPLIIIEGLFNGHNDVIAMSFGIIAAVYAMRGKTAKSLVMFFVSSMVKYTSLPFMLLVLKRKWAAPLAATLFLIGTLFLAIRNGGWYSWYFLNLFILVPYYKEKAFLPLSILSCFLLISYYPYIALGFWNNANFLIIKDTIISAGLFVTSLFILQREFSYLPHDLPLAQEKSSGTIAQPSQ